MSEAPDSARLLAHTFALCRAARAAGLPVTQARTLDVFRALTAIDCGSREDYRLALRVNLVASRADEILFERVFRDHFEGPVDAPAGDYILARSEFIAGELPAGRRQEAHREMLTEADAFAADEVERRADLALRWDADAPPLATVIRRLARRLATRPSRRLAAARRGRITRRSIAAMSATAWICSTSPGSAARRKDPHRMLCDVSGSMDAFNPFLLQRTPACSRPPRSRTVVSTRTTEITNPLRRRSARDPGRGGRSRATGRYAAPRSRRSIAARGFGARRS